MVEQYIYRTKDEMGAAAANATGQIIKSAIRNKGQANIILSTGASQFPIFKHLVASKGIDWFKVVVFHLDEYIGIGADHPASFRKYLQERFIDKVSPLRSVYFVRGDSSDPAGECERLAVLIEAHPIDVACIGIGENGHLAFNDPPADFETEKPYIVVQPNETCRKQQLGEGWFEKLEDIPQQAISMSIRQILKSEHLIVTVPDMRKAKPAKNALEGPVTPECPASILRQHANCSIFFDEPAASLLAGER